jgi:TPR repeat protein
MRRIGSFVSAVVLMFVGVFPSHAEKRVTLMIGNRAYRVHDEVSLITKGQQPPQLLMSVTGEFKLKVTATVPKAEDAPSPVIPPAPLDSAEASAIGQCDRLAASQYDANRPLGVVGIAFAEINPAEAVPACQAAFAARPNDPRITFQLGRAFAKASGTGASAEAVRLYRKAADAGHAPAMNNLGNMYASGRGVEKDDGEAARWYRKAADAGDAVAMNNLGNMYANGRGVEKDDGEAARWYRKSADAGHAAAMGNLGNMYESGRGVEQNDDEAVHWYREAADAGDAPAMSNLGVMYGSGRGVERNEGEAVRWYRRAADAGRTVAMSNLGVMYESGRGVEKNEEEAARWYRKAADAGDAVAMSHLGSMYESGRGVEKNEEEAVRWYRRAADGGDSYGNEALRRLGH